MMTALRLALPTRERERAMLVTFIEGRWQGERKKERKERQKMKERKGTGQSNRLQAHTDCFKLLQWYFACFGSDVLE